MFKKILIANRGEIARRVIHACREMDIATVAVYSDPDKDSLHVREADEAFPLQGIESSETYLDISKILQVAKDSHTEAIHPGYGFLSENAAFAEACAKAKVKFIGPAPKALKLLGSKVASKELAKKAKVSIVPGYVGQRALGPIRKEKNWKNWPIRSATPSLSRRRPEVAARGCGWSINPES
jgi:acetyl/propionyl-CoA carboxylase alpha subunit